MAIIATKGQGGNFELPPEGTFQGVIFAVWDGGIHTEIYDGKENRLHKIKIGIELDELYTSGQYAGSRITRYPEYTLSVGSKSKLLPVIESLLGRALSDDEKEGFDVESLIGRNCTVTIMHKLAKNGRTYADNKIGALLKNTPLIQPILKSDYIPDFIKKWQLEGDFSAQSDPTHGQNLADDARNTESALLDEELNTMVFKGEITMGDYKSQIMKSFGKPAQFNQLTDEQALEVYTNLINLAEFKKSEVVKNE